MNVVDADLGANLLAGFSQRAAPCSDDTIELTHRLLGSLDPVLGVLLDVICGLSHRVSSKSIMEVSQGWWNTIVFKSVVDPLALICTSAYCTRVYSRAGEKAYVSMFLGASSRYDCCAGSREVSF